jgi:hypothetical protein
MRQVFETYLGAIFQTILDTGYWILDTGFWMLDAG